MCTILEMKNVNLFFIISGPETISREMEWLGIQIVSRPIYIYTALIFFLSINTLWYA